ncbi:hypothetical protein A3D71_04775 [Candidatus Kaiserbacteria bacterium RIFCSPHIGHO2_02_FULL_55_20]|uniref:GGDEF domain-containing protein n=1 Tax=Candidatus Kaiserbacteria bacterium RIFCSPHIGHO2_02_FULL_55_20 TaxID=1798497 RepID=A0A1F6DY20_9BACT|nr:MAG: hypothetical protein A3D71_04775 [Candidatus Kaiserbacteria bacterium RIFCSPHIGHO2_02_FULL_55_20]
MLEGFSLNADTEGKEAQSLMNATERRELEMKNLQELADVDGLTGILNRRAFDERMATAMEADAAGPLSVVVMDIDHFKDLNDHYGHDLGDRVLRDFGKILKSKARPRIDHAGRIGGEEFALGLVGLNADAAQEIAETIRREAEDQLMFSGEEKIKITVSCGVVERREGEKLPALMKRGDETMYTAKRDEEDGTKGRNRVITAK